jgi:hypothetical protein
MSILTIIFAAFLEGIALGPMALVFLGLAMIPIFVLAIICAAIFPPDMGENKRS